MGRANTGPGGAATTFAWKPHARLRGDAQKVGETLEGIRQERGTLSPKNVVEHARDKASVLHGYFEWNDGAAAEKYREVQAAHLIRSIVVVRSADVPELKAPSRAFVSIRAAREESEDETPGSYTSLREALRIVDYRVQLIEGAIRDLDAYRLKYQLLSDLTGWGSAVSTARAALDSALAAAIPRAAE